jgi:glycosyltransferase involved in cell wall biosynthesis
MDSLIVFSHLRWDFVYQRPQHLMSRLARRWRVLFVEEPLHHDGAPVVELREAAPGVTVARMHTPIAQPGFHDDQIAALDVLLRETCDRVGIARHGAWLYTPMALPLLRSLDPRVVVYDCMDELAAFRQPPRQLQQRESALFHVADVVFTGGPSLYRLKRSLHPNVHCVPSSVDAAHFARALELRDAHPAMRDLPHPRLGFYGVVDERFDVGLLRGAAALRPDWSFVVVGPIAKIDPAGLPRAANIHYVGQQRYDALPGLLAAWDVALLLFARNESTRYISPTKTLEYLAAGRPVVSTPIADVAELYSRAVRFAATPEELVAAAEAALRESDVARDVRLRRSRELVAASSWDLAAERMAAVIDEAVHAGRSPAAALTGASATPAARAARPPLVVAGAGSTAS